MKPDSSHNAQKRLFKMRVSTARSPVAGTLVPHFRLDDDDLDEIALIANRTTRDAGFTRSFYSYPAKFLAHLPRDLIERYCPQDGLVFDGYCGGGTTGLEAMLLGRRFVGYDISPFAIMVSRVKTTRLDHDRLTAYRASVISSFDYHTLKVLSDEDHGLLGERSAADVERLAWRVSEISEPKYRDFFLLALIHSVKILGRRDFEDDGRRISQLTLGSFAGEPTMSGTSIAPLFAQKTRKMIAENSTLPAQPRHIPEFVLGSNHHTSVKSESVDLVVTSPPYKDLDVEYMQLQFQRPSLHRSKRSDIISKLMHAEPVDKELLCGGKGDSYWENLRPSLAETRRILKPHRPAFWWVGFGSLEDRSNFENLLREMGFELVRAIPVTLSDNRAASSRSTHHGRDTGMMKGDYLFVSTRN